jgi:hypothetical protein
MCVLVLVVLPGRRINIGPIGIAYHTHLRCRPYVRESELGHSVREAADPQSFCPDLRSENPLHGWCLVPWSNQYRRSRQLQHLSQTILTLGVPATLCADIRGLVGRALRRGRFPVGFPIFLEEVFHLEARRVRKKGRPTLISHYLTAGHC